MYENDRDNHFELTPVSGEPSDDAPIVASEFGTHLASLAAVAMLVGIAIAVHSWMAPGFEQTVLIMCLAGVGVWVLAAFALHLSAERAPLLTILFPTAVFLAVMVTVLSLVQYDTPEGIERIEQWSAER